MYDPEGVVNIFVNQSRTSTAKKGLLLTLECPLNGFQTCLVIKLLRPLSLKILNILHAPTSHVDEISIDPWNQVGSHIYLRELQFSVLYSTMNFLLLGINNRKNEMNIEVERLNKYEMYLQH